MCELIAAVLVLDGKDLAVDLLDHTLCTLFIAFLAQFPSSGHPLEPYCPDNGGSIVVQMLKRVNNYYSVTLYTTQNNAIGRRGLAPHFCA